MPPPSCRCEWQRLRVSRETGADPEACVLQLKPVRHRTSQMIELFAGLHCRRMSRISSSRDSTEHSQARWRGGCLRRQHVDLARNSGSTGAEIMLKHSVALATGLSSAHSVSCLRRTCR